MHSFEYILVLLAAVLVSSLIGLRFPKVYTPLVQVALGIILVATPIPFEGVVLDPALFMILFIVPIDFDEAKRSNKQALWTLRRPIMSLAIGLVFATTLVLAFSLNWLVPSIPLAACFAFAAALSPTDVVAVFSLDETSTIKPGQDEVVKGEGLMNDASGVVCFQFAIAAVLTASFSLINVSLSFIYMFFGGVLVGVGLMLLRHLIIRMMVKSGVESSTFYVLFEIITPCLVYLISELIGVSGIIAVVAAGIAYSFTPSERTPVSARNTIVSTSAWSVIMFVLNGLCFLMLGTQLPFATSAMLARTDISLPFLVLCIFIIQGVTLMVRFAWLLAQRRNTNLTTDIDALRLKQHAPLPLTVPPDTPEPSQNLTGFAVWKERMSMRRQVNKTERRQAHADPKYWRHHFVDAFQMTFAGPKGAITLAMIFAIPMLLPDGSLFPERDIIVFVASGVILLSLITTRIVLPFICPKTYQSDRQEAEVDTMVGIFRFVVDQLLEHAKTGDISLANAVISEYDERIQRLQTSRTLEDSEELQLRAQIVLYERQNTLNLISEGRVGTFLGMLYLNNLSRQLACLEHHSTFRESIRAVGDQFVRLYRRWAFVRHARRDNRSIGQSEGKLQVRGLRVENLKFVMQRLGELQQELADTPEENNLSSRLIDRYVLDANHQLTRTSQRIQSLMLMLTNATELQAERERKELRLSMKAMEWERQAIAEALQSERISRQTAKEMYDSVAAMELDIEGFLEF
ncbi:MAG: sodium:proton antiporter [Coriobacteriales bacterium]|jgi:CPA1 family monovalent cation:H+ antiporter|nr:sodium:proton antiporter [Coriobacteriales bacterium]